MKEVNKDPIIKLMKNVDKANKIFIPKVALEMFGKMLYMEIYNDRIVLLPIKVKRKNKGE